MVRRSAAHGFSLLETLIASVIFLLALVPALSLLTTSSAEVAKARDRGIAVQVANSLAERLRSLRPADRRDLSPTPATALPHLKPVLDAHRLALPAAGPALDRLMSNFLCQVRLEGTPPGARARVAVAWSEAGVPRRFELETRLEVE